MITQKDFLLKYNISEKDFEKTGYLWKDLQNIYDDYLKYQSELEATAEYFVKMLHKIKHVHSIRYRLKDAEHLIEKIIRKTLEKPDRVISIENYKQEITDLIGIRLIHLYKEDWLPINEILQNKWELCETPIAYFREGDSFNEEFYRKNKCDPKKHKAGYRSVHYLIKHNASKVDVHIAELQVRTLFEEGWCEIDHNIRYPYNLNNPLINQNLQVFNGLAKSADEMGSFIIALNSEFLKLKQQIDDIKKNDRVNLTEKEITKIVNNTVSDSKLDRASATNPVVAAGSVLGSLFGGAAPLTIATILLLSSWLFREKSNNSKAIKGYINS